MKAKAYTLFVLFIMLLAGAAYWADLSLFINPATGFVQQGPLWLRYVALVAVLALAVVGLRRVGPRAIGALRLKQGKLSVLFVLAGAASLAYGIASIVFTVPAFVENVQALGLRDTQTMGNVFSLLLGGLFAWYGVWMWLAARQLRTQKSPSPTTSALPGILAVLPFCLQTVYRVLINPSSIYRIANVVHILTALFSMLWLSMLLRAFYIALVRKRARRMYLLGLVTFLFATCLDFTQTLHGLLNTGWQLLPFLEGVNGGLLGLVAAGVSVAIVGQNSAKEEEMRLPAKPAKKVYRRSQF